jgi:precorrin-6B methylase 2
MIKANRAKFGAAGLDIVHGDLPGVLENLARPDRVFIGGGGNDLGEIIRISWSRLSDQGIIVAAVVRLDSLNLARRAFLGLGRVPDVVQAQFGRGAPIGGDVYLKALNPVWLVSGRKIEGEEAE